LFVEYMPKIP